MKSYIYRCSRKQDMYIYLSEKDDFSNIPKVIMDSLGRTEFVMELEINENTKLAKEDPAMIIENMKKNHFHIQLPDKTSVEALMAKLARN